MCQPPAPLPQPAADVHDRGPGAHPDRVRKDEGCFSPGGDHAGDDPGVAEAMLKKLSLG